MRVQFQVLSKRPREEWVEVLVQQGNPNSETVRVKLRELPETEFEALEGMFSGRVGAVRGIMEETERLEAKFLAELPEEERGRATSLAQDKTRRAHRAAMDALKEIRREMVLKAVVDHKPEDFEVGPLPEAVDPEERQALREGLEELGLEGAELESALSAPPGAIYCYPFKPVTWTYGEGSSARQLPGASVDVVRFYEKSRAKALLLNSLCNAVIYWHRLTLKPAAVVKEELRAAALRVNAQGLKVDLLLSRGLLKPERAEELKALSAEAFAVVDRLIFDLPEVPAFTDHKVKTSLNAVAEQTAAPEEPAAGVAATDPQEGQTRS